MSRESQVLMNSTIGMERIKPNRSRNTLPWLAAPTANMLSMPMLRSATMMIQSACQTVWHSFPCDSSLVPCVSSLTAIQMTAAPPINLTKDVFSSCDTRKVQITRGRRRRNPE